MPWMAQMAGAGASLLGGALSGGGGGPRGINFTSAQSDPWNVEAWKNSNNALGQQQGFANNAAASPDIFAQQQQLANQLQQGANGQGPNPAMAQLANTTGQNAQQQAALMGSQRGTSANAGMMARQAAMQGGAIQQQSAGQAAALSAQQQLAAQQMLMQQQNSMGQLQANAINNNSSQFQNQQQLLLNNNQQWNAQMSGSGIRQGEQQMAQQQNQQKQMGGMLNSAGQVAVGINNMFPSQSTPQMGNSAGSPNMQMGTMYAAEGGSVPSSSFARACNMKSGGQVPGQPMVAHNSPKNDTQPAMLTPGEGVIDLETMKRKDEVGKAARFVMAHINSKNRNK